MKILLFLIIGFFIVFKVGWDIAECGIRSSYQAVAPIVWYEQAIDASLQSPIVTRFYHNKLGIYMSQIARCYFDRVDPVFIFKTAGIFGVIFVLYFVFNLLMMRMWQLLLIIFIFSFLPTLSINLPTSQATVNTLAYFYKGIALIGLGVFLRRK